MSDGQRSGWFNDRRFVFNGPQRIRDTVAQIVGEINQVGEEHPELMRQLQTQLSRLNTLINQGNTEGFVDNPAGVFPPGSAGIGSPVVGPHAAAPHSMYMNSAGPSQPQSAEFVVDIEIAGPSGTRQYGFGSTPSSAANTSRSDYGASSGLNRLRTEDDTDPEEDDLAGDDVDDMRASVSHRVHPISQVLPPDIVRSSSHTVGMEPLPNLPPTDGQPGDPAQVDPNNTNNGGDNNANNQPTPEQSLAAEWRNITTLAQNPEIRSIIAYALHYAPFVLIFVAKSLLEHIVGLVVIGLLYVMQWQADRVIVRQVATKEERRKLPLIFVITMLTAVTLGIFRLFSNEELHKSLMFMPPRIMVNSGASFATLVWVILVQDLIAKFVAMVIKALVCLLPNCASSFKRRGRFYRLIEYTSQLHRYCIQMVPWAYYLYSSDSTNTIVSGLSVTLTACYFYCKVRRVIPKLTSFVNALIGVAYPVAFGKRPGRLALLDAGATCPICYSEYSDPIELSCKHVFCEDCLSTWFDKEQTCPMCRAEVVKSSPRWKDGSTQPFPQLV